MGEVAYIHPERPKVFTAGALVPDLQFDEKEHRYFRNGIELPGITRILGELGLMDVSWFTEEHREFGQLRHYVTQLDDEGDLHEETLSDDLRPTLEGWRKWRRDMGFVVTHVEVWVRSDFGYATIVDRVGHFESKPDEIVVVNLKGPSDLPAYAIQLAAETRAFEESSGLKVAKRVGVLISRDGKTKTKFYENHRDLAVWLAALSVWTWKRGNL